MADGSTMASLAFLDRPEGHLGTKWHPAAAIRLHLSVIRLLSTAECLDMTIL